MILLYSFLLIISFYMLMKVCDEYFVSSLDKIALKLKLSSEASGATLMAVGTSAPELFVSLMALLKPGDHGAMGAGTIVGSAIFNILVIVGGSLLIRKAHLLWQPVVRDVIFYLLSILLLLFTFRDGVIELYEAFIFILLYIIYVFAVINWKKLLKYEERKQEEISKEVRKADKGMLGKIAIFTSYILYKTFPDQKRFYVTFFVSIGWIIAVVKDGRCDMAISNAVGSNIFDILLGLGFPWILAIVLFGENILVDNANLSSSIILLFATVVCIFFLFVFQKWKLGRKSGLFLILLYVSYIVWLIVDALK